MGRGTIYEGPRAAAKPNETVVTSTCGHNCGGRCVVNAHVVDGRIVRISTDPRGGSRSCRRCTPARAASARSSASTTPTA